MLTFDDNTFAASLVFCPSVVKERKELCDVFETDLSAIANIENATDSDGDTYDLSPVRQAPKATLTNDDLRAFDDEMRRAEC